MGYDEMPAGRELDTAVALAFPGLKARFVAIARCEETTIQEGPPVSLEKCREACAKSEPWAGAPFEPAAVTQFSTDIAAAWQLMERFTTTDPVTEEGYFCKVFSGGSDDDKPWIAHIEHSLATHTWFGKGATGAEAICRAALDAAPDIPMIAERLERYNEQWKEEYPRQWKARQEKQAALKAMEKV